jgi:hypothetical protein
MDSFLTNHGVSTKPGQLQCAGKPRSGSGSAPRGRGGGKRSGLHLAGVGDAVGCTSRRAVASRGGLGLGTLWEPYRGENGRSRAYCSEGEGSSPSLLSPCSRVACRTAAWSGRRDSNPRPTAWKAVTLPLSYSRRATKAFLVYSIGARSQERRRLPLSRPTYEQHSLVIDETRSLLFRLFMRQTGPTGMASTPPSQEVQDEAQAAPDQP